MKKILFLGLLLLMTTAQAQLPIEHWTTPNGARVYFVASPQLPILDVAIDFAAGSAFDPPGKAGLAGLTTGLLDSGARLDGHLLNEEQLAEAQTDIAASISGSVDDDRASLRLRTLTSPREQTRAVQLMAAMLSAPDFPEAVLEREKRRSQAAIEEADTHPQAIANKRFLQTIYPQHPYGQVATVATVATLQRDDVVNFWRSHFHADRAVVTLIGAIDRATAERIARQLTAQLPQLPGPSAADTAKDELPEVQLPATATLKIAHPATQSHILIGQPFIRRDAADFFPLLVGNYVLGGGGFVSRLMNEVREKRGYAYSVYSSFDPRLEAGPFQIGLQTKRSQAAAAVELVERVLSDFLRHGPTAAELKAAQQNLIDGLALKLDSNAKMLGILAMIGYYQLPLDYLDRYPQQVAAVTAEQVRAAFQRHLPKDHRVTVMVAAD